MKSKSVTIPMIATEQYFLVVLFIMLYKMVLMFRFVDKTTQNNSDQSGSNPKGREVVG